jgi:hypothetical protein
MNRAAVTTMLDDYATLALDVWVSGTRHRRPRRRCGQPSRSTRTCSPASGNTAVKGITRSGATSWARPGDGTGLSHGRAERPAMTGSRGCVSGSGGGDTTGAERARESHRTLDEPRASISLAWTASTDNVGVTGYQIPARARRQWWHLRANRHLDDQLLRQHGSHGEHRRSVTRVRAVDAAGNVGGVEHGHRGDAGGRRKRSQPPTAPKPAAPSTTTTLGVAHVDCIDGQRGVTGYQICVRRARAAARSHRSRRRRPLPTSTRVSRQTPRIATRCEPLTRPALFRRCRIR